MFSCAEWLENVIRAEKSVFFCAEWIVMNKGKKKTGRRTRFFLPLKLFAYREQAKEAAGVDERSL